MSSPFSIALTALLLGMGVVFVALGLVVALGRMLIRITNRYADAHPPAAAADLTSDAAPTAPVVAVLAAAVAAATAGRGRLLAASSIDKKRQDD